MHTFDNAEVYMACSCFAMPWTPTLTCLLLYHQSIANFEMHDFCVVFKFYASCCDPAGAVTYMQGVPTGALRTSRACAHASCSKQIVSLVSAVGVACNGRGTLFYCSKACVAAAGQES